MTWSCTGGVWVSAWREYQTVGSGGILQGCTGNETHPIRCTYSASTVESSCSHIDDAGIRCQGKHPLPSLVHIGHCHLCNAVGGSSSWASCSDSVDEFHWLPFAHCVTCPLQISLHVNTGVLDWWATMRRKGWSSSAYLVRGDLFPLISGDSGKLV